MKAKPHSEHTSTDLIQRAKDVLREAEEQRSSTKALRRTGKFFDKDPNPNTKFWLKDTTPEEEQKYPGIRAFRDQLARQFIDTAASTDLRGAARKLFKQTITNRKNASARRSPFTMLLALCQQELLRKNMKPSLRTMLEELKNHVAPCGVIRDIDGKTKKVRWAVGGKDMNSTSFSSISRWLTENKPK